MLSREQLVAVLDAHCDWRACDDVPEIRAWHARDETELWRALEDAAGARVEVPYFAIPWPSARVVARALLDAARAVAPVREDGAPVPDGGAWPFAIRAARVVDVGCGSGIVACAAAMARARAVRAVDVDPLAALAAAELARRNGVTVAARALDVLADPAAVLGDDGRDDPPVVLCADLVSRAAHAAPFARAVAQWRAAHARVLLVDSGRPFFDAGDARLVLERTVRADPRVDGAPERRVRAYLA